MNLVPLLNYDDLLNNPEAEARQESARNSSRSRHLGETHLSKLMSEDLENLEKGDHSFVFSKKPSEQLAQT